MYMERVKKSAEKVLKYRYSIKRKMLKIYTAFCRYLLFSVMRRVFEISKIGVMKQSAGFLKLEVFQNAAPLVIENSKFLQNAYFHVTFSAFFI